MVELGSTASSPWPLRETSSVVGLVTLSKAALLRPAACCQSSQLPVLVGWFGDPLGVRISSDHFTERISEENNFMESSPTR